MADSLSSLSRDIFSKREMDKVGIPTPFSDNSEGW